MRRLWKVRVQKRFGRFHSKNFNAKPVSHTCGPAGANKTDEVTVKLKPGRQVNSHDTAKELNIQYQPF